jgi:pyrroline-5-carboxylate reductase
MSPLAGRTLATVGTGVMAESMIAGLIRGRLVEPGQVIASHPRPERRDELERAHGIRVTPSNTDAIDGADVILLAVKPQMLARVGREIGPHLQPGQLVLSVIAGATTTALAGLLGGHRELVRSMPNTPAQLGRGMTVWYPTPETSPEQRAQAKALLSALGHEIEVDDEKFVAMATAVSGTGPTYVFLVMEALIDAAVHLGFPRHVAHDLVIETLEGSTHFAKMSAAHPAVLRNMVTSPGGTSAAALHELESGRLRTVLSEAVWAAFRRTVELGDQLEASVAAANEKVAAATEKAGNRQAPRTRAGSATQRAGSTTAAKAPAGLKRDGKPAARGRT